MMNQLKDKLYKMKGEDSATIAQTLLDPLNPGGGPAYPNDDDNYSPSKKSTPANSISFLGVSLKEGYSIANFLVIPLTSSTMIYAGTFMNVAILFLLKDPQFYAVPEGEIGRVTNYIIFYSQLLVAPFILVVGYVFDIMGRKLTIFFTLLPAAILMMYIPDAAPSINMMIVLRLGIVTAISTLASHPFINDYVSKETRGRAIALQSIGVVIGDLMTFVLVLNITRGMTAYGRFKFFGFSVIAIASLFLFLVKEPRFKERRTQRGFDDFEESKTFSEKARELTNKVWKVCKSDIVFPICLFGTMTARTLHYLFGTFLTLFII
jgi:MFS family permease